MNDASSFPLPGVCPGGSLVEGSMEAGHGPGPGAERSALPSLWPGGNTQHQEELSHLGRKSWGCPPSHHQAALAHLRGKWAQGRDTHLPREARLLFQEQTPNSFP